VNPSPLTGAEVDRAMLREFTQREPCHDCGAAQSEPCTRLNVFTGQREPLEIDHASRLTAALKRRDEGESMAKRICTRCGDPRTPIPGWPPSIRQHPECLPPGTVVWTRSEMAEWLAGRKQGIPVATPAPVTHRETQELQ
jgi:hypothetical protein